MIKQAAKMDEKHTGSGTKWSTTSRNVHTKFKHVISKELANLSDIWATTGPECHICLVRFSSSSNLKRHLNYFKDRKYPCDECGTKFSNAEILQSHIRLAHESDRLRTYNIKCPVCNQRCPLEKTLRSHLCHYHGEWVDTKLSTFASKSSSNETSVSSDEDGTGSAVKNSGSGQTVTKRSRKQHLIELVKHIARKKSEDDEETTLSNGKNTRGSFKDSYWKSDAKRNNILDERGSNLYAVTKVRNNIRKQAWNRTELAIENLRDDSEVHRDASLRILYSCKDCYVPLTRINVKNKSPMESVTSTCQNDVAVSCRKTKKRVKQSRSKHSKKRQRQRRKRSRRSKLTNLEMPLVTFLNTDDVLKSETDDYEMTHEPSDALAECVDPLDIGHESVEDNCNVEEPSREMTIGISADQPVPIEFSMKTEVVNSVAAAPFFAFIPESCDLPVSSIPFKAESMDCGVEEDSAARTESSAEASKPSNSPVIPEAVDFIATSYTELDNESVECTDALDTAMKIEIEEHTISGHWDHGTKCDTTETESSGTLDEDSRQIESNTLSDCEDKATQGQSNRTMVASKICNTLFSSRRAMLRHFRDIHLARFGNTVRCTCGKEMVGRRALENHFSRHCDRVISTSRPESDPRNPCKLLDKKFMCDKCGERFWLETCLNDHPPHCELPKSASTNRNRLTQNLLKAHGIASHRGDAKEYVCRVCHSEFMSGKKLLCHVRRYALNGRFSCPYCWTVFPGARLLKGHIDSTHTRKALTLYPLSCNICHQGFTRRRYERVHMMHIHSKATTKYQQVSPVAAENASGNQCNVCNLVFATRKRFVDHTSYYNKNVVFRCNTCGEEFMGQYKVHHHRKKVHFAGYVRTMYAHHCDICKEGFTYKTHLHAHMVHVHDMEYNCDVASKYNVESEENGRSIGDKFTCSRCPKKFSTASLLRAHLGLHQSDGEMPKNAQFKCCQCGMEFSNWSGCNFHVRNAHPTTGAIHTSSPPTKRNATISTDSIDSSGDNSMSSGNFDGVVVPSTPRRKDGTANLEKSTSGVIRFNHDILTAMNDVKNSLCTICGFDSPGLWSLSRHKAMYVNSGIYTCEFCGRRFGWQSSYRDHKLKHFRRDVHNNCFCPVCDEGFENVRCLEMHTIHLHQQSLDRLERASRRDSSCKSTGESTCENGAKSTVCTLQKGTSEDEAADSTHCLTTCEICRVVFINNEKLKNHLMMYHSLADEKVITTRKQSSNATGDRFYVMAGDNMHSNTLYRYDASLTCKDCDLTFTSKQMLDVHHDILHKIRTNFDFTSDNVDGQMVPSQAKAVEISSRSHMTRSHVQLGSSDPTESYSKAKAESQTRNEASKQIDRPRAGNINDTKISQATHHNKVANSYQCRDCDIIFVDKNLLAAHERNVHHLITRDDEWSNHQWSHQFRTVPPKVGEPVDNAGRDIFSTTQQPGTQRPRTANNFEPVSTIKPPEEITISDDDTGDSNELSTTAKNPSCSVKSRKMQPMRLVHLPPGKYTIAKLKVRSVDAAVGKVMQNVDSASKTKKP